MKNLIIFFSLLMSLAFSACDRLWFPQTECDKQISKVHEHLDKFFFYHINDTLQLDSAEMIIEALLQKCQEKYSGLVETRLALYVLKGQINEALIFTDSIKEEKMLPYQTKGLIRNNVLALAAYEKGNIEESNFYYDNMKKEIDKIKIPDHEKNLKYYTIFYKIHYMTDNKERVRQEVDSLYKAGILPEAWLNYINKEFRYLDQEELPFGLIAFR